MLTRSFLLTITTIILLSACHRDVDPEQLGIFIITNQSGQDATLNVFNTRERRRPPVIVAVPNGKSVERSAGGGAGGIVHPELYFQGDSVQITFNDGKQAPHYCSSTGPVVVCAPAHSILALDQYQAESVRANVTRYTYTLTAADYTLAR